MTLTLTLDRHSFVLLEGLLKQRAHGFRLEGDNHCAAGNKRAGSACHDSARALEAEVKQLTQALHPGREALQIV